MPSKTPFVEPVKQSSKTKIRNTSDSSERNSGSRVSRRLPDAFIAHCNRRCPFGTGREQHLGGNSLFFRVEVLVHIGILGTFFSLRYRSFNATENGHDVFNWDDIQQIIRLKIDWYRILWMKQNLVILEYWKIEIPLDLDANLTVGSWTEEPVTPRSNSVDL